jgi:hypothetical protein
MPRAPSFPQFHRGKDGKPQNHTVRALEQSHSSCIPVSAGTEPCSGVVSGDGFAGLGNGLVQGFGSTCLGRAQELFELGPSLLDGVQVR